MTNNPTGPFIDQVLTGFDRNKTDFGVAEFLATRAAYLKARGKRPYILEFCEITLGEYDALAHHISGKLNPTLQNMLLWRDPREPGSLQYWTQPEFARLVKLLRDGGVDYVMARTFFTFKGYTGCGRFLRQENTPTTKAFEWRRGDEFCQRHPELRDSTDCVLQWDATLREDPIYRIEAGTTVGQWWVSQLIDYYRMLGLNAIRLGDNSYSSMGEIANQWDHATMLKAHDDVRRAANDAGMTLLSSLGPYWSFDGWDHEQTADIGQCHRIADWVLTQPLENWTDKYGVMHVHNGEYFNAGISNVHGLVNGAINPKAAFVRGLDSGDIIENWHPPDCVAIRESVDAMTHVTWDGAQWRSNYQGLYHFWSDELTPDYYATQAALAQCLDAHPPAQLMGPVLAVDDAKKPHSYVLGDLMEHGGIGVRSSVVLDQWQSLPGDQPVVINLPRLADSEAFLDETAMSNSHSQALRALLASERDVILVGGSATQDIVSAFGLVLVPERDMPDESPSHAYIEDQVYPWHCHAQLSAATGMAGRAETYFRRDYLQLVSGGASVIAHAEVRVDGEKSERVLASQHRAANGARRIFLGAIPEPCCIDVCQRIFGSPLRASAACALSTLDYEDTHGHRIRGMVRYDPWHADEVMVTHDDIDTRARVVFSSGVQPAQGQWRMPPQSVVITVSP